MQFWKKRLQASESSSVFFFFYMYFVNAHCFVSFFLFLTAYWESFFFSSLLTAYWERSFYFFSFNSLLGKVLYFKKFPPKLHWHFTISVNVDCMFVFIYYPHTKQSFMSTMVIYTALEALFMFSQSDNKNTTVYFNEMETLEPLPSGGIVY